MKHISKWTRIDYFKGLILLYFFSVICATVYAYINPISSYGDTYYIPGIGRIHNDELGDFLGKLILLAIGIEIILIIYFLPSLIAKFKRKKNSTVIFVLNLLSGGWFIKYEYQTALNDYDSKQVPFLLMFTAAGWIASLSLALWMEGE